MNTQEIKKQILERGIKSLMDEAKVPMKIHLEVVKQLQTAIQNHKKDIEKWDNYLKTHPIQKGDKGEKGDSIKGEPGESIKGDKGEPGKTVKQIVKEIRVEQPIVTEKIIKETTKTEKIDEDKIIEDLLEKLKKEQILDLTHIKGAQTFIKDGIKYRVEELMHGGSKSSGGTGYTVETPSGTIDGTNVTFTVTAVPVYIISDGATYFANNGYTISGLTLTLTSAPLGFLRSFYS